MRRNDKIAAYSVFVTIFLFTVVCHGSNNGMKNRVENNSNTNIQSLGTVTSLIAYGEYVEGRKFRRIGTFLVVMGSLNLVPGIIMFSVFMSDEFGSSSADGDVAGSMSVPFLITGVISLAVGIPMLISGTRKKEKYKKLIDSPLLTLSSNKERSNGANVYSACANFYF